MKISVITLFPLLFPSFLKTSILDRVKEKKLVEYEVVDLRHFGIGTHKSVDDRPFGGGPGMILRADVLAAAWEKTVSCQPTAISQKTLLMSASGKTFHQSKAWELSKIDHLIIICGHYEGVDERFVEKYVDEEISIGDYVLTGGELPALVIIDSLVRLLPGALKKENAATEESFSLTLQGKLEYPQYTRPETFEEKQVPQILRSGNHQEIKEWRREKSLEKTKKIRPDLIK